MSLSPEYKKASRLHYKSTKNLPVADKGWSAFRAAEKKYKAKFPPPDLSAVLNLTTFLNENPYQPTRISAEGPDVFILPERPGLVLLPTFISPQDQRHLVRWSLRDHARHPNEINLDAHYIIPPEGIWNAHLLSHTAGAESPFIQTKASINSKPRASSSGPRQLISNDPASVDNFSALQSLPKPPPESSTTVTDCPPSDLVPKLRWANIGWSYHWGTKQYDFSRGKGDIDPFLRHLCKRAVDTVPWEKVFSKDDRDGWGDDDWRTWKDTYEPDAGIVNYYQTKAGAFHIAENTFLINARDVAGYADGPRRSLRGLRNVPTGVHLVSCDLRIFTFPSPLDRLGNAAIFLIGGLTRDIEPIPILLRSGDVLIMSGPACRRAFHGVPRILEMTLPEHFSQSPEDDGENMAWEPYKEYMRSTRINVNVRQVFPKGFDPHKSWHRS